MPIIVQSSAVSPATTTVQNIIDATSQDVRGLLSSSISSSNGVILVDYVNRTHLDLLRFSRWRFLESATQRFITQLGVTNYWVGATGANTAGSYDTQLNLTDFDRIKQDTIRDRSNYLTAAETQEQPLLDTFHWQDSTSRYGAPKSWRISPDSPYILNIFPAPDNLNQYQPRPNSPAVTTTVSGALTARTYFVKVSWVDSAGNESLASEKATRIFVPANSVLKVFAPQPPISKSASGISYSQWRAYVGTTEGAETAQIAATSTSSDWTEPGTGLIAGTALPTTSAIEPLRGYVIDFRYYKRRKQLTGLNDVLQIPADYKDVVVDGVNWRALKYLKQYDEAAVSKSLYEAGKQQIVKDYNLFPNSTDFLRPAQ